MKKIIIVPCLNSEHTILKTMEQLNTNAPDIDVLIIDRGSKDRTKTILRNNKLERIEFPIESTYHKSISLGLFYAYKNNYDIAIEFDENSPQYAKDIPYLLETHKNHKSDLVLASRFIFEKPRYRKNMQDKLIWHSVRASTFKKITDPAMKFKLYGKKTIKFFAKTKKDENPTPDRIVQIIRSGFSFKEIQVKHKKIKWNNWKLIGWILSILFVNPFKINWKGRKKYE